MRSKKRCPKCDELMDLVDTARGRVYSCECGKVIRLVPKKKEEDEPEVRPENMLHVQDSPEAKRHRKELRRRRVKRQRSENPLVNAWNDFNDRFGIFGLVLLILTLGWLFGLCLTFVFPPTVVVMLALGISLSLVGHIWIIIAFQDNPTSGILCVLIGLYALIYAILNIGETWRALVLQALGIVVNVSAVVAMLAGGILFYHH